MKYIAVMCRAALFIFFLLPQLLAAETISIAPIGRWIAKQSGLQTISADFQQTRALKSLRDPLMNPGHFWFRAPDAFRWELGNPARSILLRNGESVLLIEPAKKRATRFTGNGAEQKVGARGLMLMRFPMAANLEDFKKQFDVIDLREADGVCDVSLLPKDVAARKFLTAVNFQFVTDSGELRYFEILTREGSRLRNDFSNVRVDEKVDPSVFEYDLSGYTISDAKD